METNVVKTTESSTSEAMAIKIIDNSNVNVDTKEAMYSEDMNVPSDNSDYDILEEEKTLSKNDEFWVKN